jgi:CubicO group peptidase (beta-lactamase class C family)
VADSHITFGLADVAKKRSMSKDSMFWIASMTKPMTAMGVMMLVEEGKVKLDDPLEKFVPEFKGIQLKTAQGLVAPKRAVTVKDLLTHTSGIDTTTATAANTPVDTLPVAEMCVAYAKKPLVNEPGSQWTYNNNGINLLGRIIEVASGKPFADFMEERLFEPLGMTNTTFYPTDAQWSTVATGYAKNKETSKLEAVPPSPAPTAAKGTVRPSISSGVTLGLVVRSMNGTGGTVSTGSSPKTARMRSSLMAARIDCLPPREWPAAGPTVRGRRAASRPAGRRRGGSCRARECPRCGSFETERLSAFGSTACKALHRCLACREPFEHFKPI